MNGDVRQQFAALPSCGEDNYRDVVPFRADGYLPEQNYAKK